jgi:hypothetical protein
MAHSGLVIPLSVADMYCLHDTGYFMQSLLLVRRIIFLFTVPDIGLTGLLTVWLYVLKDLQWFGGLSYPFIDLYFCFRQQVS